MENAVRSQFATMQLRHSHFLARFKVLAKRAGKLSDIRDFRVCLGFSWQDTGSAIFGRTLTSGH